MKYYILKSEIVDVSQIQPFDTSKIPDVLASYPDYVDTEENETRPIKRTAFKFVAYDHIMRPFLLVGKGSKRINEALEQVYGDVMRLTNLCANQKLKLNYYSTANFLKRLKYLFTGRL